MQKKKQMLSIKMVYFKPRKNIISPHEYYVCMSSVSGSAELNTKWLPVFAEHPDLQRSYTYSTRTVITVIDYVQPSIINWKLI